MSKRSKSKFFYNLFSIAGVRLLAQDILDSVLYSGMGGVKLIDSDYLRKKSRDMYRISRSYYKKAENAKDPRLKKSYKQ